MAPTEPTTPIRPTRKRWERDGKPGAVEEVNDFLRRLPSRQHLLPMVPCDGDACTTLVSSRKRRVHTKRGQLRLCVRCVEPRS